MYNYVDYDIFIALFGSYLTFCPIQDYLLCVKKRVENAIMGIIQI
jgi:hypothetical protein